VPRLASARPRGRRDLPPRGPGPGRSSHDRSPRGHGPGRRPRQWRTRRPVTLLRSPVPGSGGGVPMIRGDVTRQGPMQHVIHLGVPLDGDAVSLPRDRVTAVGRPVPPIGQRVPPVGQRVPLVRGPLPIAQPPLPALIRHLRREDRGILAGQSSP
jgi:hypothetical protein